MRLLAGYEVTEATISPIDVARYLLYTSKQACKRIAIRIRKVNPGFGANDSKERNRSKGMTSAQLLKEQREEILAICARYGARNVRIFGSVARGDADEQSDIDFIVDLEEGRTLFDLGGLQYELELLLKRPVDIVTESGLKLRIRDRVLHEAIAL